jgi:peptide/nickel transport system permease protein
VTAPAADRTPVRWRDALPPGVGHLRRGFRRASLKFFALGAAWLGLAVFRGAEILRCFRFEDFDRALAAVSFAAIPVALVVGARFDLSLLANPASAVHGASPWRLAYDRFVRNARARAGLWCLGFLYLVALLRPVIATYDPVRQPKDGIVNQLRPVASSVYVFAEDGGPREHYAVSYRVEGDRLVLSRGEGEEKSLALERLGRPKRGWSLEGEKTLDVAGRSVPYREEYHLLGTDESGRDLFSRIVYGSAISLWIGLVAMAIAATIGAMVGALAGYFGGWVDAALMRVVDVMLAFPLLLLLLLLVTVFRSPSIWLVVVVLGATGWMGVSRLVRAEFLRLRELDFTTAARALGLSPRRVMFRHLLPNAAAPIIVDGTLRVGSTILTEAALSYLGSGVQAPQPSWGNIVNGGSAYLHSAWWIATLPGLAIVFTVMAFNLVGDALRDALDPRLKA